MNIYLDIDGVLLTEDSQPANFVNEFLQAVLTKHPDSSFWLTTHCWKGKNNVTEVLTPHLKAETLELLKSVKPTDWNEMKTEAIDFEEPFLWFAYDLWPEEINALEENDSMERCVLVNLAEHPDILRNLAHII